MKAKNGVVHVVGGGLAGCEAAWQVLRGGYDVVLHEMRPTRQTAAHETGLLAELVCSNSLKSLDINSAPGLLKAEMTAMDSLIIRSALEARVPAGQALAVDRAAFSATIAKALAGHAGFSRVDDEVTEVPTSAELAARGEAWIIATGPLTSPQLASELERLSGGSERLYFYDAIAPVVAADSIDLDHAFRASRYGEPGTGDYLNLPLFKDEYEAFIDALLSAEYLPLHNFEDTRYFEACLPIEVMVARGRETLRFGPMKPVGLTDPRTGRRPWAVLQLRQDNLAGTMYSLVGFQTKMKWPAQKTVFGLIPGLRQAEFLRFGSVHRNTYVNGPKVLSPSLAFRNEPRVHLAGQITGVEGYTESAAMGLLAGRSAVASLKGETFALPPATTVIGALARYVTEGGLGDYQPMNANLGLLPPEAYQRGEAKSARKARQCDRARDAMAGYLSAPM